LTKERQATSTAISVLLSLNILSKLFVTSTDLNEQESCCAWRGVRIHLLWPHACSSAGRHLRLWGLWTEVPVLICQRFGSCSTGQAIIWGKLWLLASELTDLISFLFNVLPSLQKKISWVECLTRHWVFIGF
jgi:hypothetical protein